MKQNKIRETCGASIIEVMILSTLLLIVFTQGMQVFSTATNLVFHIDSVSTLRQSIMETSADLNTKNSADLPVIGKCWVRKYSLKGEFVSTSEVDNDTGECVTGNPDDTKIKVLVKSTPVDPTEVTFNPAQFLKLPVYSNTVRKIEIIGMLPDNSTNKGKYQIVLFKSGN